MTARYTVKTISIRIYSLSKYSLFNFSSVCLLFSYEWSWARRLLRAPIFNLFISKHRRKVVSSFQIPSTEDAVHVLHRIFWSLLSRTIEMSTFFTWHLSCMNSQPKFRGDANFLAFQKLPSHFFEKTNIRLSSD